ncbi:hypothetical protein [Rhodopirellula sp. MGV]|uniref:hypothetical protein n=1 Tax=Rhodopirellula sp. MGV TaxID=2023130 RepID=UPI00117B9AA2|nr:hypothetical protein [Rhodopirellula sp. MGV]
MRSGICMLLGFLTIASLVGCSQSKPEISAEGTVTVDGQALSGAVMTFEPMGQTTGPKASAPVFSGKFSLPPNNGLHGGSYRVRFSMIPAGVLRSLPDEQKAGLPPSDAVIAPEFDENSKLECTLQPDQENILEFDVSFL